MGYRPLEERRVTRRANTAGDRPPSREAHESTPTGGRRRAWTRVARGKADAAVANLSAPVAGALAAAWGAVATLMAIGLLMIAIWVLGAGEGSAMGALQAAGNAWLVSHLVPVSTQLGQITLLPIGLIVIPGFGLWRAGTWAARRSGACYWREVRTTVFMATAVYATIAMMVAGLSGNVGATVSPVFAIVICGAFAFLVFGGAAFYEAGLWPRALARLTGPVRNRVKLAAMALLVIGAGSAGLIAVGLLMHFSEVNAVQELLGVGFIGAIGLLLVCVAYLPNALIWAASYTSGVGFNIGGGGMVTPFSADVGAVPAFPLLVATPNSSSPTTWFAILVPVIGGIVAVYYARKLKGLTKLDAYSVPHKDAAWVAGMVAVAMMVFSVLAGGSIGSQRMANLGPAPFGPGIALGILVFFGLLAGGGLVKMSASRARRRSHKAAMSSAAEAAAQAQEQVSEPNHRKKLSRKERKAAARQAKDSGPKLSRRARRKARKAGKGQAAVDLTDKVINLNEVDQSNDIDQYDEFDQRSDES